jgi:hypothetical protein
VDEIPVGVTPVDEHGGRTITVVLPVDGRPSAALRLAARPATMAGRRLGVVDNGLWRSMGVLTAALEPVAVHRYDHLAPDFPAQQAALADFATDVDLVVSGLGN